LLLQAAHHLLLMLVWCLQQLQLPLRANVWQFAQPEVWQLALATGGVLLLFLPVWRLRVAALCSALPLLLQSAHSPPAGELWLTVFDIGQGMALLLETAQHRLLYDAGPSYPQQGDAAQQILLPYLRARGIRALDGMIISHADSDHAGGAASVLQQLPLGWWMSTLQPGMPLRTQFAQQPPYRQCAAGQAWEWDGIRFRILHPAADADLSQKTNALSCTLRIELPPRDSQGRAQPMAVLLAGDIEAPQEAQLLAQQPQQLPAQILLVPHHGSGTSSTLPFLQAVQPQLALFQLGYHNRYHHPRADVWQRYGTLGIQRARTDVSGALLLRLTAQGWQLQTQRAGAPHYWQSAQVEDG